MSDQTVSAAVQEVVQDAADEAVQEVRQAAAVEAAAERVEDAADRVEDAAGAHEAAVVSTPSHDEIRSIIRDEVQAALAAVQTPDEPITHEHAVEVAEAAAESAVEQIVEEAQDAADEAAGDVAGPDDVELPGDVPDQASETVEDVSDVVDGAADEAPRNRHWLHRPLGLGGRS